MFTFWIQWHIQQKGISLIPSFIACLWKTWQDLRQKKKVMDTESKCSWGLILQQAANKLNQKAIFKPVWISKSNVGEFGFVSQNATMLLWLMKHRHTL